MLVSELSELERQKGWVEYRAGLRQYPPGWERLIEVGVTLEEIWAAIAEGKRKLREKSKSKKRVAGRRQRTTDNGQLTGLKKRKRRQT